MRSTVAAAVAALLLAGPAAVAADEATPPAPPSPPPPADQLGSLWFADPANPPAPAGTYERLTYEAPPQLESQPGVAPSDGELPPGVPPAAATPEPSLPQPPGWPVDAFPRTSGTGRHAAGAFYWSDFLYDDNGAIGVPPPTNESTGAPSFGTYRYPDPAARGNGADVFRVAVRVHGERTEWRVDWNTLEDPSIPMAVFTVDSDPTTGVAAWPANARLRSPGIDHAVVVSGRHAYVVDLRTGDTQEAQLLVDEAARSFVAATTAIPTAGDAVVRMAAGLAGDDGRTFRTLDADHGALPGQPNVYNVAFRDYTDEPSVQNTWFDSAQSQALTNGGDVSPFSVTLEWERLRRSHVEPDPEPLLGGYTNRWYVSSQEFGQGIGTASAIGVTDPPLYLGRVQPYGIYVPTTYDDDVPAPLTWMLHGATSSHNSTLVHPRYLELACERRGSICVSPLGRGPNGGWRDYAELDVWEVWNRVAAAYALDPDRTIVSGISMGGFGTYKLAMDHPEAFVAAVAIVAHANRAELGHDRLTNLRWTPLYARHGTFDQLVPITEALATQQELDRLQLRHVFDFQPAEDHVVVALKDAYDDVAEFMASVDARYRRPTTPPRIDYAWDESVDPSPTDEQPVVPDWAKRASLGLVRTGAWWLDGVDARDDGTRARIAARSFAVADPPYEVVDRYEPRVLGSPSPTLRHVLDWVFHDVEAPATEQRATLALTNVAAVSVAVGHAGLEPGATVTVRTDGPTVVTLGQLSYELTPGEHTLTVS